MAAATPTLTPAYTAPPSLAVHFHDPDAAHRRGDERDLVDLLLGEVPDRHRGGEEHGGYIEIREVVCHEDVLTVGIDRLSSFDGKLRSGGEEKGSAPGTDDSIDARRVRFRHGVEVQQAGEEQRIRKKERDDEGGALRPQRAW